MAASIHVPISRPVATLRHGARSIMSHTSAPTKRVAPDAQEAAWVADEDRFVLQQAKKKAALRVKGGRASPLDWLAVTLAVIDPEHNILDDEADVEDVDLRAPESVLEALGAKELAEVEKGIEGYEVLESSRSNVGYWQVSHGALPRIAAFVLMGSVADSSIDHEDHLRGPPKAIAIHRRDLCTRSELRGGRPEQAACAKDAATIGDAGKADQEQTGRR